MSGSRVLVRELASLLKSREWKIVTAESCTGGLLAGMLTSLDGSSAWFERGFVTYSNIAKEEMLGVDAMVLTRHGAVSEPVALAMASGALAQSHADMAVAVTGIAGPGGGSPEKPVGTVWFGWAMTGENPRAACHHFPGTRTQVRQRACEMALAGCLEQLMPRKMA